MDSENECPQKMEEKFWRAEEQKVVGNSPLVQNVDPQTTQHRFFLRKTNILQGFRCYQTIFLNGQQIRRKHISAVYLFCEREILDKSNFKIGFAVRNVATKVERNYYKRLTREFVRQIQFDSLYTIAHKNQSLKVILVIDAFDLINGYSFLDIFNEVTEIFNLLLQYSEE